MYEAFRMRGIGRVEDSLTKCRTLVGAAVMDIGRSQERDSAVVMLAIVPVENVRQNKRASTILAKVAGNAG